MLSITESFPTSQHHNLTLVDSLRASGNCSIFVGKTLVPHHTIKPIAQDKIREHSGNEVNHMPVRQPRYNKEEFTRRGNEIYESQVRPQVEEGNQGKIVAIDIETGAFELGDDLLTASKHLSARMPDAQTWFVRIGHSAVDHFGARSLRTKQ
jgi:hypothetical protein